LDRNFFSDGIFTAPVTGKYSINVIFTLLEIAAAHTDSTFRIITSNRTYIIPIGNLGAISGAGTYGSSFAIIADMDASDTFYINVTVYNGTKVIDLYAVTYLSVALIC